MNPERASVVDVAIDSRSGGGDQLWTYRCEGRLEVGDALLVPLGTRAHLGYVFRVREASEVELGFEFSHLRSPIDRVDDLELPEAVINLARFVAEEYLCPIPVALSAAVPPGARDRLGTSWRIIPDAQIGETPISALQRDIMETIRDAGGILEATKSKKLDAGTVRALRLLRAKGLVESVVRLVPTGEKRESSGLLRLTNDTAKIEQFLLKESRKKPAQAVTIMRLQAADHAALTSAEIRALGGVTEQTIKALTAGGLLESLPEEAFKPGHAPTPTKQQEDAIDAVHPAIREALPREFLLYGVTGSGKTEVFLRCAAEALRSGRQVLYLVPEIALATQAIGRLRERFGRRVAILHSELPPRERLETWQRIRNGETPIVLGARSALFAPLSNIGLIVMDEEHEGSYKQESSPRYHSKRLARFLSQEHEAPLLLGSATPSVETFYEAEQGKMTRLDMPDRAASAKLPSVHVVDLAEGFRQSRPALLGPELLIRMEDVLKRNEQAIIFLNRRAYAPFLLCRDCGHTFICPQCAVSLSYSRRDGRLRCHHCGHQIRPPDKCPSCGGNRLSPMGVGTERVEEALTEAFPGLRVARLDRDITQKKGALEEILAQFRSRDLQVLVGTQMVAKGLDFPGVTLVGVVAADISLNIPDFRSTERTFQLLTQVAGRAGRGTVPGHVVIQTFNPKHLAIQASQRHDYQSLYEFEIKEREAAQYPPFIRLVNVVFMGEDKLAVEQLSSEAKGAIAELPSLTILGPVDCPIERLQGRWRRHILIKAPLGQPLSPLGVRLGRLSSKSVHVTVDVDPYSLM